METLQPVELLVQGGEEQVKSTTASRVPALAEAKVLVVLPVHGATALLEHGRVDEELPQNENASFLPSLEKRGDTAATLLQFATASAVLALVVAVMGYSFE